MKKIALVETILPSGDMSVSKSVSDLVRWLVCASTKSSWLNASDIVKWVNKRKKHFSTKCGLCWFFWNRIDQIDPSQIWWAAFSAEVCHAKNTLPSKNVITLQYLSSSRHAFRGYRAAVKGSEEVEEVLWQWGTLRAMSFFGLRVAKVKVHWWCARQLRLSSRSLVTSCSMAWPVQRCQTLPNLALEFNIKSYGFASALLLADPTGRFRSNSGAKRCTWIIKRIWLYSTTPLLNLVLNLV